MSDEKPDPRAARTPASKKKTGKRQTRGWYVIRWIEEHCVHTKGEWIGKPFKLLPWQKRIILSLFEVESNGLRRYRWALIGVPKKNGKTELAAALALYFLIGDGEPSPLVVCAASSEEQADLVFGAAKTMATMSPTLALVCEVYEKVILVPSIPGAELKRVAAVAGANDGMNIHAVICDELHEWAGEKGEKVWNVLTNGTGARRQPMVLQITTAGYDRKTVCYRQYKYGLSVQNGHVEDRRFFFYWKQAPKDADWHDPKTWEECNPSYGIIVHEDFFADQLTKKPENVFRRYFLNQWTQAAESWLPSWAWTVGARQRLVIPKGGVIYVGVDIGVVEDASAVSWVHPKDDLFLTFARIFEPPGDGTELDLGEVEAFLRELRNGYRLKEVAYDPQMFIRSAQTLSDEGFLMVKFPQTDERMCPATKTARELITAKRVIHPDDEAFAEHVEAGVLTQKERGYRLTKRKAAGRTDACMAMVMALDRAAEPTPNVGFD